MSRSFSQCLYAGFIIFFSALPTLAQTPLLPNTVVSGGTLRNNYTGFVGMEFSFGASFQISSLGRAYFSGNTGTHTVKLVNAATGVDVPGASVQITMNASGSTPFQYAALASPVTLQTNTNYLLLSSETAGGDFWNDLENIAPAGGYQTFSIGGAVYSDTSGAHIVVPNTAGFSYVPANLLYGLPSTGNGTSVAITSPTSGQILPFPFAMETFAATVTASGGVAQGASLQFQLDGENYGAPQTAPTSGSMFSLQVNPGRIFVGTHVLSAVYTVPGAIPVATTPVSFSIQYSRFGLGTFFNPLTPGPLRNNYTGFVGMEFVSSSYFRPLITCLGRYVWPGNTQSHVVKLVDGTTGQDVPGGAVIVSTSGVAAGQFAYTYLQTPILLSASDTYYVVSQETAGGDQWADYGSGQTIGIGVSPVYSSGSGYVTVPLTGYSFVPVNFGYAEYNSAPPVVTISSPLALATLSGTVTVQASAVPSQDSQEIPNTILSYQLQVDGKSVGTASFSGSIALDTTAFADGLHSLTVIATDSNYLTGTATVTFNIGNGSGGFSGTPFVTSFTPTTLRHDFEGLVGMEFQVGAAPLQVSLLGRYCSAGNNQTHTIKLVQAATGADIPGGTASVQMSGCTAGQFVYASLPSPVNLAPGVLFYLVDQEISYSAEQWYDYSPVTTTGVATVIGPVYAPAYPGGIALPYTTVPIASTSYVPLNFQYSVGSVGSNSLTTAISRVSLVKGSASSVTATAAGSSPITSVQIQIDGYSLTPLLTSAPYTQSLPSINLGTHNFTSVAKDSAGETATSAPFADTVSTSSTPGNDYLAPLITFTPGTRRNNYTGWVGLQFTQGGSINGLAANTPQLLGRACLTGNTLPHLVKIVRASDGIDVASTWINCSTVSSSLPVLSLASLDNFLNLQGVQFSFGQIQATLTPNTKYYLVSQETAGGDQFTDLGPANPFMGVLGNGQRSTTFVSNFTIDGPVYFDGAKYVLYPNLPNYSYAGVYFVAINSGT